MNSGVDLLSSFDRSWKEFSEAWKKARSKASEKSVHDLRVKTRRFIAVLDLAQAMTKSEDVEDLRKRFKKVLKRMGPLRDLQVQLENVSQIPAAPLISDFKDRLERRERREIKKLPAELKRGAKHRLQKEFKEVLVGFGHARRASRNGALQHSVERVLASRRNEFLKAEQRFKRVQPNDEEALHEMRIALKKMRYVVEAAQPVLGPAAKRRSRQMKAMQQLMGDSRDLEMLRAELEKWAKKRGRRIAVVPALERLQEKRESLIGKIVESLPRFDKQFQAVIPKPVAETTRAVSAAPAATTSQPDYAGRPDPRPKK